MSTKNHSHAEQNITPLFFVKSNGIPKASGLPFSGCGNPPAKNGGQAPPAEFRGFSDVLITEQIQVFLAPDVKKSLSLCIL